MKNSNILFIFFIPLFFIQCGQSYKKEGVDCNVDLEFISNYTNCVFILIKARQGTAMDFEARYRAVECLEAVTLHESNIIKYSDSPYLLYKLNPKSPQEDLFDKDLEFWLNWLNSNKCNFNTEDAKSAFLIRSKSIGVKLDWPLHYLGK